jgi:hypothetical protein
VYRNRKRIEAHAVVAAPDVIEAGSWKCNELAGDVELLSSEALAAKFRDALKKRHRELIYHAGLNTCASGVIRSSILRCH